MPPLRQLLLWVHMLGGLTFSVYAVLLGVSGSALVFRQELTKLEFPQFHGGLPPDRLDTTPDQALAAAREALPGWHAYSVTWPNQDTPHWTAYMGRGGQSREVFIDSSAAHLIGSRDTKEGWTGALAQTHFNLLLGGPVGHVVQECGVIALLLMCGSGLALLWPAGAARWASRLRVDFRVGWRKLSWQLHHFTGAAGITFIAMWALT